MKASSKALQNFGAGKHFHVRFHWHCQEALFDGEIDEVEHPENASGASLFRFVTFKATDKVCHKKKVETDKPKMIPMAWISLVMM